MTNDVHRHLISLLLVALLPTIGSATDQKPAESTQPPKKELFSGKILLAREALKRRGVEVSEEMQNQAVFESSDGEIIPIAADWRGRAFFQDKRLRDRQVELVGFRRPGVPYLQVILLFMFDEKGERHEVDYWCDICAIPLYELKVCECCQEPIRLRYRPAVLPDYLK